MKNNRTWIVMANEEKCNHRNALNDLGFISWTMNVKSKLVVNDVVYLFMKDERAVRFKLRVDKVNVPREDSAYWNEPAPQDRTYRLVLEKEYEGNLLNESVLKSQGFVTGQSIEIPCYSNFKLINYIGEVFDFASRPIDYLQGNVRDEDEDFSFQIQVQEAEVITSLSDTAKEPPTFNNGSSSRTVAKKANISKQALKEAHFKCVFDNSHETFLTNKGLPYMEGHHLIPCTVSNVENYWNKFGRNIDCVENIVCLCPTCHRRIHFGSKEEKERIIEALYNKQISSLKSAGFNIPLKELMELYNIK